MELSTGCELAGNGGYLSETNRSVFRLPLGLPEVIEAFANIYRDFATSVHVNVSLSDVVPSIDAGIRGMAFVKSAVKGSRDGSRWVSLAELQLGVAI
jgi:hypothetical protein